MASTTFSGQLSLVDFTVDEVARIDPKSQFDPDTSTSIYKIEGVLKDNVEEKHALCVWLQHSVHRPLCPSNKNRRVCHRPQDESVQVGPF